MKKTKLMWFIPALFLLAGCVSTGTESKAEITSEQETDIYIDDDEVEDVIEEIPQLSEAEVFFNQIKDIDLIISSSPKRTNAGKAFASPYVVKVSDVDGNPVSGFSVTVNYPSSRENNAVTYSSEILVSKEDGTITFTPGVPSFPCRDKVTFYPTPSSSDIEVTKTALGAAIEADWLVRSTMIYKSGVLYVWDLNEKGRPTANSTAILTEFRNNGISAGNAPVSDSTYLSKGNSAIYKANKEILDGSGIAFLIIGTVEFIQPVYEEGGMQVAELKSPVVCIDMKNGNEIFSTEVTNKASGKTYWQAVENCKEQLAKKFIDAVMYGM